MTTVTLTGLAQQIVDRQMASGAFNDPAEVVEAALAFMWNDGDREYWHMVERKLDEAVDDVRAGRVTPHSPELFEDIKRRGRARLAAADIGQQ